MDNKRVVIYTVGILGIVIFTFILSQFHIFNSSRSFMFIVLLTVIMVLFNEIQNARKDSDSIFYRPDRTCFSNKAVLPVPTGPPMPIRRGSLLNLIMIGKA